jgi:hypothetical protein
MKTLIFSFCGLLAAVGSVRAQIAEWTFDSLSLSASVTNSTSLFNVLADIGSGTASSTHATSTVFSTPSGNGSAESISATRWTVGDYWQFQTSTLGYSGIEVSWDQTGSSTGPGKGLLEYSTDGTAFTAVGSDYTILVNGTPYTTWGGITRSPAYTFIYNLSSITALNNAPSVFFRLVDDSTISAGGGTVGTAGTDRVDNFTVAVVPEPAGAVLGGLGLLGWSLLRRRN